MGDREEMEVREKEEGAWPVLIDQKGKLALVGIKERALHGA